MILVGYTEFRSNMKKYLQLSIKERVVVKSGGVAYEVSPSKEIRVNPSPSGDAYFDVPENVEAIDRALEQVDSNQCKPWSEVKTELGL